jgi:hypothetical protein
MMSSPVTIPKAVAEYPLPATSQTHEVAYARNSILVVTQQTESMLVQLALDPATGRPTEAAAQGMPVVHRIDRVVSAEGSSRQKKSRKTIPKTVP